MPVRGFSPSERPLKRYRSLREPSHNAVVRFQIGRLFLPVSLRIEEVQYKRFGGGVQADASAAETATAEQAIPL